METKRFAYEFEFVLILLTAAPDTMYSEIANLYFFMPEIKFSF